MAKRHAHEGATGESQCNCTHLRKATRRVSQLYDAAMGPSGLKATQRAILAQIDRGDPATVGELAGALVMDPGALAHTLKPLEREGFVAVTVDPDDRRSRRISLTRAGEAKLAETDALWARAQASFEAVFGADDAAALRRMMKVLISDDFVADFERKVAASDRQRRSVAR